MILNAILNESIDEWASVWVHYSRIPVLKINTNPSHQDPAGLYFFPADFEPHSYWTKMPYKFRATLKPTARILDLSRITQEELETIVDTVGITNKYTAYMKQYPPENIHKRVDMVWSMLQAYFAYENGNGKIIGAFNKMLRSMGYDAVFDDTMSIHTSEVQLLVLDPRCINIIGMDRSKGSGYTQVQEVAKQVAEIGKNYGTVTIEPAKKERLRYSDAFQIVSQVRIEEGDNQYIVIKIFTDEINPKQPERIRGLGTNDKMPTPPVTPEKVRATVRWASPSLGAGYGSNNFDIAKNQFVDLYRNKNGEEEHGLTGIVRAFDRWKALIAEKQQT